MEILNRKHLESSGISHQLVQSNLFHTLCTSLSHDELVKSCKPGGLKCLTLLSAIFQLYRGGQFYWWMETRVFRENHRPAVSH
jgi:hypothetical protein